MNTYVVEQATMRGAKDFAHYTRNIITGSQEEWTKWRLTFKNPYYGFVQSTMILSMEVGSYKSYLILRCGQAGYGIIQTASCDCAAGQVVLV